MSSSTNVPAPLFFVSPAQINAQVPFELSTGPVTIRVTRNLASSASQSVSVAAVAPAIFTTNQRGSGAGLIFHAADFRLVTAAAPAQAGESLILYCTGLGALKTAIRSGDLAPSPAPETVGSPQVSIGGINAPVTFSGAATGLAGVYRIDVQVPAESPRGSTVPVSLAIAGVSSNGGCK